MTRTTQETRRIEKQVAEDLKDLYIKILKDTPHDVAILQRRYGPKVEQTIRSAVQKLYLLGADYSTKTQSTTAFITQTDLTNIKKHTDAAVDAFWRRISNAIHKKDFTIIPTTIKVAQVGDPTVEDPFGLSEDAPSEPNPEADAAFLATLIATTTLALSTLAKLEQLPSEQPRKLVWVSSQDDKVCPVCMALEGREWLEGDNDIPIPGPDGSHFSCRCRLIIQDSNGDLLVG